MRLLGTVSALCLCAAAASAQTAQTEFDRIGFQPNRDYLQLLPFEHLDTMSGNIVLTLPQLTLPGNAGHTLQFQLTYNATIFTVGAAPWTFGMRGLPMQVDEQATPGATSPVPNTIAGTWGITPVLRMADGGTRRTMFLKNPNSAGGTAGSPRATSGSTTGRSRRSICPMGGSVPTLPIPTAACRSCSSRTRSETPSPCSGRRPEPHPARSASSTSCNRSGAGRGRSISS